MIHLTSVERKASFPTTLDEYPYNVPVIARLDGVRFETPVTFLVGENGSGKSTLMEMIAAGSRLPAVGASDVERDDSLAPARKLARSFTFGWAKRNHRGFFLRAEDFFGFARRMAAIEKELEADLAAVDAAYAGRSDYAKSLARMPHAGELAAIRARYGDGLDARSHGESFLALFQARFVPGGLYLLDEPEAPLSPLRQVGFLALLHEMVQRDAQFIIATHSPILMAYPGATILSFDEVPPRAVAWEQLEHVAITRDFLNQPGAFLANLL
jgi:predicted ATPase